MTISGSRMLQGDREPGKRFIRDYLAAEARFNEGKTPRNLEIIR